MVKWTAERGKSGNYRRFILFYEYIRIQRSMGNRYVVAEEYLWKLELSGMHPDLYQHTSLVVRVHKMEPARTESFQVWYFPHPVCLPTEDLIQLKPGCASCAEHEGIGGADKGASSMIWGCAQVCAFWQPRLVWVRSLAWGASATLLLVTHSESSSFTAAEKFTHVSV